MNNNESAGDAVRRLAGEVEAEFGRLMAHINIAYLNDEVVPEVRRSCSAGLRLAAEQLGRMAEQLDRGTPGGRAAGAPAGPAAARASR